MAGLARPRLKPPANAPIRLSKYEPTRATTLRGAKRGLSVHASIRSPMLKLIWSVAGATALVTALLCVLNYQLVSAREARERTALLQGLAVLLEALWSPEKTPAPLEARLQKMLGDEAF